MRECRVHVDAGLVGSGEKYAIAHRIECPGEQIGTRNRVQAVQSARQMTRELAQDVSNVPVEYIALCCVERHDAPGMAGPPDGKHGVRFQTAGIRPIAPVLQLRRLGETWTEIRLAFAPGPSAPALAFGNLRIGRNRQAVHVPDLRSGRCQKLEAIAGTGPADPRQRHARVSDRQVADRLQQRGLILRLGHGLVDLGEQSVEGGKTGDPFRLQIALAYQQRNRQSRSRQQRHDRRPE